MGQLEMQIEDINDKWDQEIEEINQHIKEAAIRNKLVKEKKKYKFKEFNITDTYFDKSKQVVCFKCSKGVKCQTHKFLKKEVIEGDENFKPKNLGKIKVKKVQTSNRVRQASNVPSSDNSKQFDSEQKRV